MKILFDCTFLDDKPTGIPVYFYSLFRNLLKLNNADEYIIIVGHRYDTYELNKSLEEFSNYRIVKIICFNSLIPIISSFIIPIYLRYYKADVYHNPRFFGPFYKLSKTKIVITVHDLYHKTVPEQMPWKSNLLMNVFSDYAIKRADQVIVISNQTKQDVIKYLNISEGKLNLIYQAVDGDLIIKDEPKISRKILDLNLNNSKNILCVGTMLPSKGLQDLVLAFANLYNSYKISPNLKLIFAGKTTYFTEEILKLIKSQDIPSDIIKVLGFVSDDELIYLYQNANIYVIPSYYEGFGLTAIEAMGFDCPVIARNSSSLIEVVGDAGLLFNNIEELTSGLFKLLNDTNFRSEIINKAKIHRMKFTNKRRTAETYLVYKKK